MPHYDVQRIGANEWWTVEADNTKSAVALVNETMNRDSEDSNYVVTRAFVQDDVLDENPKAITKITIAEMKRLLGKKIR